MAAPDAPAMIRCAQHLVADRKPPKRESLPKPDLATQKRGLNIGAHLAGQRGLAGATKELVNGDQPPGR